MPFHCQDGRCQQSIRWMSRVLWAAGLYHILFAVWANFWPCLFFDWVGLEHPNHPGLWRCVGLVAGVLGIGLCIAAKNPIGRWSIVLVGFAKFTVAIIAISTAVINGELPLAALWVMAVDDLLWFFPFLVILWACVRAHTGVPPSRSEPLTVEEAAGIYKLSNGETLADASQSRVLALVFLRHFGCTFTRQILRGLESIQEEARQHGAELVLVHMLQSGKETEYLGESGGVTRIADPRCELYRSFGLGKGGFLELFGPHVWWRGALALFQGCGVGHLAGDGMQMPGAFLFHKGEIISSQRAHSASDLPNLPELFRELPTPLHPQPVTA